MSDQTTDLMTSYLCLEQIFQFDDADSGETYWWNATQGKRLAEARNAETVLVYPAEFGMTLARIRQMYPELDEEKAWALPEGVLQTPLLFIEHRGKHVLIDGWHRLYLAVSRGEPCLPAYILTQEEADDILITEDMSL